MSAYYQNDNVLPLKGYEIYYTRFSDSILVNHFPEAAHELKEALANFEIRESQIIEGGGGLSSITRQLGNSLKGFRWTKENIESSHHVRGRVLVSESHEVDHYKTFEPGSIGLEIEWNNKDPFFDRDLENFRKLHQIGELSLGIIITRGASLQKELFYTFQRFLHHLEPLDLGMITQYISLSRKAEYAIAGLLKLPREESITKMSGYLYASKYGKATTHMDKLLLRLDRGLGDPCPLILIGISMEKLKLDGI